MKTYIDETKSELGHVSWPTKAQAVNSTVLVVVISLATAAYLSLFDGLFAYVLKTLLI
ncbi:MAG: preprotein translocase subunit SecE [Candidatus Vogelbacteria bacterium]|nr:preprotein translocase subunit SecE [Candidatus Vogelbacteria bacterium]